MYIYISHQAPLPMGFPRQEYWSGLHFPFTLVFWMLNFKPAFSLSSFTLIKRLFSFSSVSAIRVVSPACPIFLPAILIPVGDSSSPEFLMMYSAYKLNKQGDNIQPWHTPFPILNQSVAPRLVLIVALWPAYRFLRRQVTWPGIPVSLRTFYSLLWSTLWCSLLWCVPYSCTLCVIDYLFSGICILVCCWWKKFCKTKIPGTFKNIYSKCFLASSYLDITVLHGMWSL